MSKSSQKHNGIPLVEKLLQDPKAEFRLLLVITKKVPARGHGQKYAWKRMSFEKTFISTPFSSLRLNFMIYSGKLSSNFTVQNFRPQIPASTISAPQPAGSSCSATHKKEHLGPIDLPELTWQLQNLFLTMDLPELTWQLQNPFFIDGRISLKLEPKFNPVG